MERLLYFIVCSFAAVGIYSVYNGEAKTFGQLYYAEVECLEELPSFEISEIKLFNTIPESLTYPLIQPYLFKKVVEFSTELERN